MHEKSAEPPDSISTSHQQLSALSPAFSSSSNMLEIPVIDLKHYKATGDKAECDKAAESLHKFGVLCVRDERAADSDNDTFLDMMEQYFESTDFKEDARPEYHYQVGVTPELKERARNHCARAETLDKRHAPVSLCPPEADKKSRFFWRVGERPVDTKFKELNAEPVIPKKFPEWENVMNMWGGKMLDAITDLVEIVALGLGLEKDVLVDRIKNGPHLLAPTGSNFNVFNQLNDVLAAYHYDLNLLTIHGKSRFPGLYIWLRDGTRTAVKIPDGCLLVQAGKQMEYLTGGYVQAGFHEVVVAQSTLDTINQRKNAGKSLWRVSSTLFSHTASDKTLEPLGHFATPETLAKYPPIFAGSQVLEELSQIELGTGFTLHREFPGTHVIWKYGNQANLAMFISNLKLSARIVQFPMAIYGLAVATAALVAVIAQAKAINHDKVAPFPATLPNSTANAVAIIYQPQIYIHNGCHPYPAVNTKGDTSAGLKPTGKSSGKCKGSKLGSQVYGRIARYKGVRAIMYSWYFPKDSPKTSFGHRHDWEHVIVWVDSSSKLPGKILAMTPSAHSGYSTYAPPDPDMVDRTSVKVEYTSSWGIINHHLTGTSTPGNFQNLVMWEDMTDAARLALNTTQFGSANVPMNEWNFLDKLRKAYPFNNS